MSATTRAVKNYFLQKKIIRQLPVTTLAQDCLIADLDEIYPEASKFADTVEWIESLKGSERLFNE